MYIYFPAAKWIGLKRKLKEQLNSFCANCKQKEVNNFCCLTTNCECRHIHIHTQVCALFTLYTWHYRGLQFISCEYLFAIGLFHLLLHFYCGTEICVNVKTGFQPRGKIGRWSKLIFKDGLACWKNEAMFM